MADSIFQPKVTDVGVDVVSSAASMPSYTSALAGAIKNITDISEKGVELYYTGKLKEETQQQYDEFVAKEDSQNMLAAAEQTAMLEDQTKEFFDQGDASPQEAAMISDMRSRISKYNKAFMQKRIPAAEFKVKLESTLKKYINMQPALASEFRKTVAGITGFDPTGAELDAIFAQQKAAAKQSNDIIKATVGVMKKWGMINPQLSTQENINKYGAVALELERNEKIQQSQYDAANRSNLLTKEVQNQMANQSSGLDLITSGRAINAIVDGVNSGAVDKIAAQRQLEALRTSVHANYQNKYSALDATKLDGILRSQDDLIKQGMDLVSGKVDADTFNNTLNGNVNRYLTNITNTPVGVRYMANLKMMKGLPSMPASIRLSLNEDARKIAELETKMFSSDGRSSPFDVINDQPKDIQPELKKYLKNATHGMLQNMDTNNQQDVNAFGNLIKGMLVPMFSDPDEVEPVEFDTMLKIAGDPKFVDFLKASPQSDKLKDKIDRATSAYRIAIITKFGNEVFDHYDPEDPKPSLKSALFGSDGSSFVELDRDSSGMFHFSPKGNLAGEKAEMASIYTRAFNNKYASRLNDAIKVSSHLTGHTKYKAFSDRLLETPALSTFLRKKQGEE